MKKKIVVNSGVEELRVATLEGNQLSDLILQIHSKPSSKSNIYLGKVSRIEPSLEAVFVDYGDEKHGFLSFKELPESYFEGNEEQSAEAKQEKADKAKAAKDDMKTVLPTDYMRSIDDIEEHDDSIDGEDSPAPSGRRSGKLKLQVGELLLVQVNRDKRGTKGAYLTAYISLPGRYLVFLPFAYKNFVGGISKRIDDDHRRRLKDLVQTLKYPEGSNFIVRTVGANRTEEELQLDLDRLVKTWGELQDAAKKLTSHSLIYCENDLPNLLVRDFLDEDVSQVLIDDEVLYKRCIELVGRFIPEYVERVQLYTEDLPIFAKFGLERKIQELYSKTVSLPSGGTLVIDTTEALVSVDVNSSKSNLTKDVEETAIKTNLEAAIALARELKLRDLGGLVVVDFIDMSNHDHQNQLYSTFINELKKDKAKIQVGQISIFGLLELSRQRIGTALYDINCYSCPKCSGTGKIRVSDSLIASVMMTMQEEIIQKNVQTLIVELPMILATFLINNRRKEIYEMEQKFGKSIRIIPSTILEVPHYTVKSLNQNNNISTIIDTTTGLYKNPDMTPTEHIAAANPLVQISSLQDNKKSEGLFSGISSWIGGLFTTEKKKPTGTKRYNNSRRRPYNNKKRTSTGTSPRKEGGVREQREQREPREAREPREYREHRAPRENREHRENRENKTNQAE